MRTYIALFRGINVGGHHKLPMKELKALLEDLCLQNVKSYIQSGNVVFQSQEENTAELSGKISAAVNEAFAFEPHVLLLKIEEMEKAVAANPFPEGEAEPKTLHLFFLIAQSEKPDLESLENLKTNSERFELKDRVFYLHAPEGIGRSKLAERVDRFLGVSTTARNWRTVSKIMEMAKEYS